MKMRGQSGRTLLLLAVFERQRVTTSLSGTGGGEGKLYQSPLHEIQYRIPIRDGKKLRPYMFKDTPQPYPILMQRTPYRWDLMERINIKNVSGLLMSSKRRVTSSSIRTCAGRYLSEGQFLEMHPHIRCKEITARCR